VNNNMKKNPLSAISRAVFAVATLAVFVSPSAQAQTNVSVDLSVLLDGGYTSSGTSSVPLRSDLMMPSANMPKSKYYGPAVTVTNPISAPTPSPAPEPEPGLTTADVAPPPAPEPEAVTPVAAPEPEVADVAPPAAPEPEIMETPEQPPEPEAVAEIPEAQMEEASAENTEVASVTSGPTKLEPGRAMMVLFDGADTKLSTSSASALDAIAATISANEDLRIQLKAFAGGDDLSSSKARRMSLSRALAVRSYFIEQGVRSTRIDVRALGSDDEAGVDPINRVDVNITER
jgi:outer membrane protein OmpA-like peptidoglycan-associated protein